MMRYLSKQELQIASRFLFLSMAIIVIRQDVNHIRNGQFKIKEPYITLLEHMLSVALNERKTLRKQMRNLQLQVLLTGKNDSFSSYLFICQGREEQRNYFNPVIRKKVEYIIQELMFKAQDLK
ncbi:MAG TPA: hypothetical protein VIG73_11540 [Cerasibacillus sp.]|uniref:hypothetical protein n=1 Tax=Cerasibacillus sp. TaxID=2498711 RepID=UPI002F3FFFDD